MDIVTFALAKKMCAAAASGIADIQIDGTTMKIITNEGKTFNINFPVPAPASEVAALKKQVEELEKTVNQLKSRVIYHSGDNE